jgi:hypothetical protein
LKVWIIAIVQKRSCWSLPATSMTLRRSTPSNSFCAQSSAMKA